MQICFDNRFSTVSSKKVFFVLLLDVFVLLSVLLLIFSQFIKSSVGVASDTLDGVAVPAVEDILDSPVPAELQGLVVCEIRLRIMIFLLSFTSPDGRYQTPFPNRSSDHITRVYESAGVKRPVW